MSEKLDELRRLEVAGLTRTTAQYRADIDKAFTIGPKVHGGSLQLVVAEAARRGLADLAGPDGIPAEVVPVALASDFMAAPDPAGIDLAVTVRKRGRTVSIADVEVSQHGRAVVSTSVTLAATDDGPVRHSEPHPLDDLPVEPVADGIDIDDSPLGQVINMAPAVDLVLDPLTFPVARGETGEPVVRGWARPKGGEPDVGFAVLICDISPPVIMNLGMFGWAPTVQLTTYVRRRPEPGWLRFAATTTEVGQSMFIEDHLVVDRTGVVVAQSRQLALLPKDA